MQYGDEEQIFISLQIQEEEEPFGCEGGCHPNYCNEKINMDDEYIAVRRGKSDSSPEFLCKRCGIDKMKSVQLDLKKDIEKLDNMIEVLESK